MLGSSEVVARLQVFSDLLVAWNQRINLIGGQEPGRLLARHIADSLALLPLLPPGARRLADLGAGGGFPGLVVAIAAGIEAHLIDRDQRKCAFLREAARATGTTVVVHATDFARLPPLGADVVASRATAALPELLSVGRKVARRGCVMLFHKSEAQAPEIEAARGAWRFDQQVFANPSDPRGRLWRLSGVEPRRG